MHVSLGGGLTVDGCSTVDGRGILAIIGVARRGLVIWFLGFSG